MTRTLIHGGTVVDGARGELLVVAPV